MLKNISSSISSMTGLALLHSGEMETLHSACIPNIKRWHAGTDSTEPWGYYTPRIVHHYTTGGVKRGRLVKTVRYGNESEHRFLYGISAENKLIYIRDKCTPSVSEHTYLLYSNASVIGITYNELSPNQVCGVTECSFYPSQQINSFKYLYLIDSQPAEFVFEEYSYDSQGCICELSEASGFVHTKGILSPYGEYLAYQKKAYFLHDQSKRFTGWYEVNFYDTMDENLLKTDVWKSHPFAIKHTRADIIPSMMTIS